MTNDDDTINVYIRNIIKMNDENDDENNIITKTLKKILQFFSSWNKINKLRLIHSMDKRRKEEEEKTRIVFVVRGLRWYFQQRGWLGLSVYFYMIN